MAGYGTDEEFQTYAEAAGYTVPTGTVAAARQRGSAYLDGTYEDRWPGVPTGGVDQERSWPRTGATDRYGNAIDPATVPQRVINASYEAAMVELQEPGSLSVVLSANERVKSLKAGSVAIDYADAAGTDAICGAVPKLTVIEGILAPLLRLILPGVATV